MKVVKKTKKAENKKSQKAVNYSDGVSESVYNNRPMLTLPLYGQNSDFAFKFGLRKAKCILKYYEDIKKFVEAHPDEKE